MNFLRFIFSAILLIGLSQISLAQNRPLNPNDDPFSNQNGNTNPFANDSTKTRKRGGKILDDSTKLVYGAYTTKYFLESDWFYNTERLRNVDTLLSNFHRYKYVEKADWELQNLGNLATASRPVFYNAPDEIGNRLGISAFDHLFTKPSEMQYYNTKSPHSRWYYVQGGQGRTFLDAEMAQNINPRINAGFMYRRVTNRLLLGTKKINNNDRQSDFQNVMFQTSIQSADGRYKILGNYNAGKQKLGETGGLSFDEDLTDLQSLFEEERRDLDNQLDNVNALFQKNKLHIYQQFSIVDSTQFQVYHELNWTYAQSTYSDSQIDTALDIYPSSFLSTGQTNHKIRYDEVDNRVGVKFRKSKVFLASYFRHKTFGYAHFFSEEEQVSRQVNAQSFVGVVGNYFVNDSTRFDFEGEYLLFDDYKLSVTFRNKLFDIYGKRTFSQPSLFEQYYYGNNFRWQNDFRNTISDEIGGVIHLKFGKTKLEPFANFTRLEDYIYFDETANPVQSNNPITQLQLGVRASGEVGEHWRYNGKLTYTENDNETKLPVPQLMAQFQWYFQKLFFDGAFPAQIGVDAHYNSDYFAPNYQPVLQQFYLQDRFQIGNYPVVDFFMNGQVKKATIFVKFTNILQPILGEGYYDTVGYMAQPLQFEFGFRWLFYD